MNSDWCMCAVCLCFIFALSSCCCEQYPLFLLCMLIVSLVYIRCSAFVCCVCVFVSAFTSFVRIAEYLSVFKNNLFSLATNLTHARTYRHIDTRVHRLTHIHTVEKTKKKSKLGIIWPEGALITIQFSSLHDVIALDELE